ncbi:MAG: tetratricopeptide repeat protein, partial [Candidatus Eremiobacteraeota bacterium]|nr:tetratricopeptide repeat protein [Candidatus Eremiobacteraeota bacterium]
SLIDWVYSPSGGFHAGSGAIRSFSSAVCALAHAARGNVPLADLPFYLWASRRALVALVGESGFASWLEVDSQAQVSQLVLELRQAIHQASPLLSKACLRALAQRSEGNFGGALEAFRQAVAEAPQCGLLRSLTGRCLMSLDRVDEAKKCLGEAGKLPRLLGEDLLWLSVLAMDLDRDFNRAATYLEQAVEHEPLNPLYRSVLAIAYGNAGQIENALLAAEVACRYGPHLSQSWEARGRALRHQGSYQEALVCFGRAMRLGADPCEMSAYRALCLAHLGDFVGAQLDLELAARSGRTLAHQGLVTAMAGQKKEARALLEAYFAGDYKSELHEEAQACLGGLAKSWFRNPFKR